MRTARWLFAASAMTAVGLWSAACGDSSHPAAPPPVQVAAQVVLSQTSLALKPGDKVTLTAQPQSSDGTVLVRPVTWATDNASVATVTATGATTAEVTAVALGTAKITATADGQSASTSLTVAPVVVQISASGGTVVSADSNFILEIPAGALDVPTTVAVTKADVAAALRIAAAVAAGLNVPVAQTSSDPVYIPGTGYNVVPSNLQLKKAATIKIKYSASALPSGFDPQLLRIRLRTQTQTQTQWQECDHTGVQANMVIGSTQVLSTFALYGRPTQPPVAGSVNVKPSTLDVETGDVVHLTAEVLDTAGTVLTSVPVTWAVDDPAIATVDATGVLTAIADGTTSVTATAGGKQGSAGLKVSHKVGSVDITAVPEELIQGSSAQLVADVRDPSGSAISNPTVTWTSLTPNVATVDQTGKVSGVSAGDATIVASSRTKSDTVTVTVSPQVASITISGTSNKPLAAGATLQLSATAYNSSGQPVSVKIKWTTSSSAIATVSSTGLVTGVASGTATITASASTATASVSIKVTGGETTTTGNNLSWPVVFAEGLGLTGLPVATDPGVRPLTTETGAYAELTATPATNPTAAYFYTGNVLDATSGYYLQATASTWRAQIVDGTGKSPYDASIYWGDNVAGGTGNLGAGHPIRVEVALSTTDGVSLLGYNMPYVVNASTPEEIQGTDGTTLAQVPLIYSGGATLTIEQLSGPGGNVVSTVSSAPYKAEINVGGRIIYGAQFTPAVAGTYRLRFILATEANAKITAIGNTAGTITIVNPKESAIEIQVTP